MQRKSALACCAGCGGQLARATSRFLVLNMKDTELKGETLVKRGGDFKKKKAGRASYVSNNNICPSLQTAHTPSIPASLRAVVSMATSLSSPLLRSVSANKSLVAQRSRPVSTVYSSTRSGTRGRSRDVLGPVTDAPRAAFALFAAYSQTSKNSCPVLRTGSGSPSDHFSRACVRTLNEMNFQRRG